MTEYLFVQYLYEMFHDRLSKPVKDFEEIQMIFQELVQKLLRKYKKLFEGGYPRKNKLYNIK